MELHISRLVTDIDIDNQFMIFCSDGSNNVQSSMFEAKNRVLKFDYQKMNTFEFLPS